MSPGCVYLIRTPTSGPRGLDLLAIYVFGGRVPEVVLFQSQSWNGDTEEPPVLWLHSSSGSCKLLDAEIHSETASQKFCRSPGLRWVSCFLLSSTLTFQLKSLEMKSGAGHAFITYYKRTAWRQGIVRMESRPRPFKVKHCRKETLLGPESPA